MSTETQRVLVIYGSHTTVCGVGTWVESLSAELGARGIETTAALVRGLEHHVPEAIEAVRPALRTVHLDVRSGTEEGRIREVDRAIRASRASIVIVATGQSAFEGARRARWEGADFRLIAVNHGNLPHHTAALVENADVIDHIAFVSGLSYEACRRMARVDAARLHHLPHGVPPADRRRAPEQPIIGYAGRLHRDKNADDLVPFIRAMRERLPASEVWVAGEGPVTWDLDELSRELWDGGMKLFGAMNREALYRDFYPQLSLLVHFSNSESFGFSLAEAMAHGVPPVCALHRGMIQNGLVEDGLNARTFPAGDTLEAAGCATDLLNGPERLEQLSHAAHQRITEQFSMDAFAARWLRLINQALEQDALPKVEPGSLQRKGRFGLRETSMEALRRATGRQVAHTTPREEWPPYRCHDAALVEETEALFAEMN